MSRLTMRAHVQRGTVRSGKGEHISKATRPEQASPAFLLPLSWLFGSLLLLTPSEEPPSAGLRRISGPGVSSSLSHLVMAFFQPRFLNPSFLLAAPIR